MLMAGQDAEAAVIVGGDEVLDADKALPALPVQQYQLEAAHAGIPPFM
jgi:hypothetical protein